MQHEHWPKYAGLYVTFNPCCTYDKNCIFRHKFYKKFSKSQFYENVDENSIYVSFVFHLTISTLRHIYIHLHTICLIGMTELGTATFHFAPNRRWFHWSISQWILLRGKNLFGKSLKSNLSLFLPYSLLTRIWTVAFLPILVLFHWNICLCVCISVIKPIIDEQRKPSW